MGNNSDNVTLSFFYIWNRQLNDAEIRDISHDPGAIFRPPQILFVPPEPDEPYPVPVRIEPEEDLFGVDIDVLTDLNPAFTLARGDRNLANAIGRRLQTPAGKLADIGDDPDYGMDIRSWLNTDLTTTEIAGLENAISDEILKDERIVSVVVDATYSFATAVLEVEINALKSDGAPFRLVLRVSSLTVDILAVGQ